MKSVQLKITLLEKKKRIMREVIVSKKTTYEQLHQIIQVLFNLDGVEEYAFKVANKWLRCDSKHTMEKTLFRIKKDDVFEYYYDALQTLCFKVVAEDIIETEQFPVCIGASGKNLYENVYSEIETSRQSKFSMDWVNESLKAFHDSEGFLKKVKEQLERLVSIRFFQDYMHNQIIKIHLPQDRIVYMGCDASDEVVLNFHINGAKLMEYTSVNQTMPTQSMIKYHDCIECSLLRLSRNDEDIVDFKVGNYGVLLSFANIFTPDEEILKMHRHIYTCALEKYVDAIEYCAKENKKYKVGQMIEVDETIHECVGQMQIYPMAFEVENLIAQMNEKLSYTDEYVEVDVLTMMQEEDTLSTICIIGNEKDGFIERELFNASVKTMGKAILELLVERWKEKGIDSLIRVCDINLKRAIDSWIKPLNVSCEISNLKDIKKAYLSEEQKHVFDDMEAGEILLKLLKELGVDLHELRSIKISKEDVKKLKSSKDHKKYS